MSEVEASPVEAAASRSIYRRNREVSISRMPNSSSAYFAEYRECISPRPRSQKSAAKIEQQQKSSKKSHADPENGNRQFRIIQPPSTEISHSPSARARLQPVLLEVLLRSVSPAMGDTYSTCPSVPDEERYRASRGRKPLVGHPGISAGRRSERGFERPRIRGARAASASARPRMRATTIGGAPGGRRRSRRSVSALSMALPA